MRKSATILLLLFCFSPFVSGQKTRWGQDPNKAKSDADYPIKMHISGLHLHETCFGEGGCEDLIYADAIMDGKKIELTGKRVLSFHYEIRLFPGDYQARLLKDAHYMDGTPIYRRYELVLPDQTVWRCTVTGISE
jgi:hypothetical protein